jgi:hypothetical protein
MPALKEAADARDAFAAIIAATAEGELTPSEAATFAKLVADFAAVVTRQKVYAVPASESGAACRLSAWSLINAEYFPTALAGASFDLAPKLGPGLGPPNSARQLSETYQLVSEIYWRRGRDSNPRYACAYSAFRVRRDRPLCHLSGADCAKLKSRRKGRHAA